MTRVLGVDVGGSTIMAGVVEDDRIIGSVRADTGRSPSALVDSVVEAVDKVLAEQSMGWGDIEGVGVGMPAFMNPESGRYRLPNIPGGTEVDLKEMLSRRLDAPFVLGNDADYTAVAVAERVGELDVLKEGSGSNGMVELVLLTLGTGIGGGVIVECDGRREIMSDGGGLTELGHIKVTETPEYLCGCGAVGCVEATSSCSGVVKTVTRRLENAPEEVRRDFREGFDARSVDLLSQKDNTLASQVMESAGRHLGLASANLLNSFNPSYLAYAGGGADSPAEGVFFRSVMEVLEENSLPEAWDAVSVVKNPDAKRYGVLGAARMVLRTL